MKLCVLGPVEVLDGGRDLLDGCRPAHRAVAALLAIRANMVVSRGQLIDWLWGDRPPRTADNLVQGYVCRLRRALSRGTGGGAAGLIATRSSGYRLQLEPDQLDLLVFQRLTGEGERALVADNGSAAAEALSSALALWRGPALAGLTLAPIGRAEAARLEELRVAAFEQRVEADLVRGRHGAVVGELRAMVAEHPTRERLRAQLMTALWRSGRAADALAAYRDTRDHLIDELGIEPGPDLRRLHRAILASTCADTISP
jgi:DNA-binding SARP family transcriptional activator